MLAERDVLEYLQFLETRAHELLEVSKFVERLREPQAAANEHLLSQIDQLRFLLKLGLQSLNS
jgi:hypothetical protein